MKLQNVTIPKDTVQTWIDTMFPNYDVFFFSSNDEAILDLFGHNMLLISKNEFNNNTSLSDLDTINIYETWKVKNDFTHVCIVHPDVLANIDNHKLTQILIMQKEANRGLIFEWDLVLSVLDNIKSNDLKGSILDILSPYKFEYQSNYFFAIQKALWHNLHCEFKVQFLQRIADMHVDLVEISDEQLNEFRINHPHIARFFNTFSPTNGANCLAATLAAVSEDKVDTDWMISKWLHDVGFLNGMQLNHYSQNSSSLNDLIPKDVVVWKSESGTILHACYYLGNEYFFNKNGQSIFNPWQIVSIKNLNENWGKERIEVYRRVES